MSEPNIYTLDCGIKVAITRRKDTKILQAGVFLNTGSRDEPEGLEGIAHFWEHMAFKGTTKRKVNQILNGIDSVGGELNAFTTKEKICFFATVTADYTKKCLDLLIDIVFRPTFPPKEILKEKKVVLEEMAMYEDEPGEKIGEEFEANLFGQHPLAVPILGYADTVNRFDQNDLFAFHQSTLKIDKIAISLVSPWQDVKVLALLNKLTKDVTLSNQNYQRTKPKKGKKFQLVSAQKFGQTHCMVGGHAPGLMHPDRIPFALYANLLGGPAMNSRLNLNIREKYGYMYDIHAGTSFYQDSGVFYIYFGCDPGYYEKTRRLVRKELLKLSEKELKPGQLKKAIRQYKGQLAISEENNQQLMLYAGKALLDYKEVPGVDYFFGELNKITPALLIEVASKYAHADNLSALAYIPHE
jgi:predicted Zn-dependent peptidase